MKYPFNYLLQIGYNLSFILITLNKMILSQDVPETCKNISIAKEPLISLDVNDDNFIMAKLNWTAYNLSITHNIIQLYAYPCKSDETKSDIVEIIYNYKSEIVYSPDKHSHIFLHHNCNYTFTIEDGVDCLQKIDFRIPVCVENNCCDPQRSPVQILEINSIKEQEGIYNVSLNVKEESVDLSNVFYVYRREDSDIFERVKIHPIFENTSRFQLLEFNFEPEEDYSVWLKYDNGSCQIWSKFYFKEKRNNSLYVIFVIVLCILTILTTLLILKHRKSVWNFIKNFIFFTSTEQIREVPIPLSIKWASNIIYPKKNVDNLDKYEIDRDLITFDEKIGEGEFGMVYKGFAALKPREDIQVVAIKQTKEGAPEKYLHDFKMEIDLMKKIGKHEHIVNFLGCCMESQPNLILMEYLDCGNLKTYLENLRKDWESKKAELEDTRPNIFFPDSMAIPIDSEISYTCTPGISPGESSLSPLLYSKKRTRLESVLTEKSTTTTTTYVLCSTPDSILKPELSEQELHSFALQIARGMEYLESIKVTHRDLAARNVLIKLTSNEKRLKISDFGFSRVGPYTSYKNEIEPRRWMSIEAIEKHRCDNKSDVWSYGVVLWEIGTLGAFPYETIDDYSILPQLKIGVRLKRPQVSSDKLYDLMMSCWLEDPMERPNFSEVVTILTMEQMPYSLSRINQDYVFPSLNYVQVLGT
ncbi:unnamed protein product [Brassicogethes aeneus]|uniref:Tyrosine-protein kinase catalytic domain-containing protein n=1 Tax=Brassicogethes aeneus TaxID=1431903 RepID=A0A9P0B5N5_BRAAE|nr:unnamed protein product [Brassicogethes aeneus]